MTDLPTSAGEKKNEEDRAVELMTGQPCNYFARAGEQDNLGSPAVVPADFPPLPPADGFARIRNEHDRFDGLRDFWFRHTIKDYVAECVRLAVADERERCAKLGDELERFDDDHNSFLGGGKACASAIRSQGNWCASLTGSPEYKQEQREKNALFRATLDSTPPGDQGKKK